MLQRPKSKISLQKARQDEFAKLELEEVKLRRLEVQSRRRKELFQVVDDYIGFAVSKTFGLTALIIGSLETFAPDFLPIVLNNPQTLMGIGLALLIGKKALNPIAKFVDSFREGD
jgi:hypothetical protein